jgi:predicted amidohydrolase
MKIQSQAKNAAVTGSVMIQDNGNYYNRMIWAEPDGKITHYDKRHLFRMAGEHDSFSQGKERIIVEFKGWKIMLQICYDLRFPVFARNRYINGHYDYDLVLYVANWPKPRHNAWADLLRARAIENLSYCAGVNRVGKDGNGLAYKGGSAVIDYMGRPVEEGNDTPCIIQADLKKEALLEFRDKFPTGMDADGFTLMA